MCAQHTSRSEGASFDFRRKSHPVGFPPWRFCARGGCKPGQLRTQLSLGHPCQWGECPTQGEIHWHRKKRGGPEKIGEAASGSNRRDVIPSAQQSDALATRPNQQLLQDPKTISGERQRIPKNAEAATLKTSALVLSSFWAAFEKTDSFRFFTFLAPR